MKKKTTEPKRGPHRRRVQISISMPVTVDMIVETDDLYPSALSDWQIAEVRSISYDQKPGVRSVTECMHEEDFTELSVRAAAAEDL